MSPPGVTRPYHSLRTVLRLLIVWVLIFLSACAGLYPALYTQPGWPDRSTVSTESSRSAIAGAIPTPATAGAAPSAACQTPAEFQTISVATLNMFHGLPRFEHLEQRKVLILEELRLLGPDVVLLQEVPVFRNRTEQIGPWLAEGLGFHLAYARANGRAALIGFEEGEAVLSRFPIREVQRHVLLPKPGLFENRIVLRAVIETPLGAMEVYNTHFSHRVDRDNLRLKQAADLIHFLENSYRLRELPAVVGGDINAIPDSATIRLLLEEGLVDTALQVDPPADGQTSWLDDITDPTDSPKARIDYLFLYAVGAEQPLTVGRCSRFLDQPFSTPAGPLWASDHVGVLCELTIN
ncbi:MAG: endonuclease/exonuclease/phosphatase family protein [Spirochaetaceae bacterium]|nr:MAG: endonuclease/exonuclease/phosphatase family protein [Spirochaetaceae bacterium]